MYDQFKPFIGIKDAPNLLLPVDAEQLERAEQRLGYRFPQELRTFYCEVGYGFWTKGIIDKAAGRFLINRIIPPDEVADLVCDLANPLRPHGGLGNGELPFFDLGERDYLVIRALSHNPHQVWFYDRMITESVVEFLDRLYERAGFFGDE